MSAISHTADRLLGSDSPGLANRLATLRKVQSTGRRTPGRTVWTRLGPVGTRTILGPHAVRDAERPARLRTSRHGHTGQHARADQGKRVTAASWGSSGRRFKSCQPDKRTGS